MAWLALLVGLPVTAQAQQAIRAQFRCLGRFDAVDVTALFFNQPPAELLLLEGQTATRLAQLPSADGGRYGGGGQEFWVRGDRARWSRGTSAVMQCQATTSNGLQ